MKLYLLALSFYPLLMIFFIGVWFRIHIISSALLYALIFWIFFIPYIIVFFGTVVIPEKKEDSMDKKDSTNKEDSMDKEGGA